MNEENGEFWGVGILCIFLDLDLGLSYLLSHFPGAVVVVVGLMTLLMGCCCLRKSFVCKHLETTSAHLECVRPAKGCSAFQRMLLDFGHNLIAGSYSNFENVIAHGGGCLF